MIRIALAAAALMALPTNAQAANSSPGGLKRSGWLGAALSPASESSGAMVGAVAPSSSAAMIGLAEGDRITAINDVPIAGPADVVRAMRSVRAEQRFQVTAVRAGRTIRKAGRAVGRPMETYANATVDYGAVPFRDERLRDILVMPKDNPNAPVLFYIQGYTCASMEVSAGDAFPKQFGDAVLARGLGYYRVEKIGVGDSDGPNRCQDVDFATELEGFKAGYRHLIQQRGIKPDRIFMVGHSMGGIQAPMLAADIAPRGVAVFGTVVRNWADYHQDLSQTQEFLILGRDPVESAARGETRREALRQFYFLKKSPTQIAAENPENGQVLREIANWDGGQNMFGRSYRFAQDLSSIPLIKAWKDSNTHVLSIYGESDMVALTDVDHRYLVDIVNYWRPGSGTYALVPLTDHPMNLVGTREQVRAAYAAGAPPPGSFNPKVVDVVADWIAKVSASPPLATAKP